jgi:Sulfatase
MVVLPLLTFVALGLPTFDETAERLATWRSALAGAGYGALSLLVFAAPGFQSPLPVDTNVATVFAQYLMATSGRAQHLSTPMRPAIPAQPRVTRPSVLLLVHESLRADVVFPGLDYRPSGLDPRVISPYSSRLVERRSEGYFVFSRARTDSTATESSVPAILSGLELGGPTRAFGRAQSFWTLGKAAYLHTFLFAALDYEWSHFDEYFLDRHVDLAATGRDISRDVVNDTGIDDGLVVDTAIQHLESLAARKTAFAGVIHFNGTHMPGYPGPGVVAPEAQRGDASRYGLAARYIDRLVERLDLALNRLGLSDSTIVISTSDHGENLVPTRPPDRLGSYYEETLRVPFWIRLPPKLAAERPELVQAFDDWRDRNVQNSDILPTVRDLIGLGVEPALLAPALPGRSLARAAPAEQTVSGQSTCAFRVWGLEGFFVIRGRKKLIVGTDQPVPRLFDLETDPREENNLWNDPGQRAEVLPWFEKKLRQGEERMKLCARIQACPFKD